MGMCLALASVQSAAAQQQQTNQVERKVENPITDTPNVNPLSQEQPLLLPTPRRQTKPGDKNAKGELQATDEFEVRADRQTVSGTEKAHVFLYEGNVDARIGIYRIQADKITVYEATNKVIAEGNVVFDQGEFQRITGARAEWNYGTKLGFFDKSTGFTNQTQDGTVIYFTADHIEKVGGNRIIIINGQVTACDEQTPKWSFKTKRAEITLNDRVRLKRPSFLVKGVPVALLPFASISIKQKDRASGFLTPTFGGSGKKGFRLSTAYYQTLGRSADVTLRNDIFTSRGLGLGVDVRTRANSRSFFNFGFYAVEDRVLGHKADDTHPDQGGSSFYVDGVHYFPNGFLAAADINITSNLAFRQIFSDNIQQAISPEERSQVFVNKNFGDYSFNFLARSQVTSIPTVRIRTRQLPSIELDKRPGLLALFEKIPLYFSFEGSLDGVSRKETVEDNATFLADGNQNPIITPSVVQRLDFHPMFTVPFSVGGWGITAMAGVRGTYYSNSIDPTTRLILPTNIVRGYGEFSLDVRPPALARNFHRGDGSFLFRHVIEPYFTYRKTSGISNFERIIRFDSVDTIADTNEVEYGVANRFFTRRSTESVTGTVSANKKERGRKVNDKDADEQTAGDESADDKIAGDAKAVAVKGAVVRDALGNLPPLTRQPYEFLSVTIRQKYFFDSLFDGALIPGQRNQFSPINTFSGFTYGGVPRRFSPLNIEARLRQIQTTDRELFADVRTDIDTLGIGGGLRDLAVSFGIKRRTNLLRVVEAFQTFYYTRAVTLAPSIRQFSDRRGNEPGTLQGSQWSPSIFVGNRDRGLFGGVSFFFDFQNRPGKGNSSLINSTSTVGYTWDCCSVTAQFTTFNVGLRQEKRTTFSFRLNGIGAFGTEQIGQRF